jgi:hypothetical protein
MEFVDYLAKKIEHGICQEDKMADVKKIRWQMSRR